MSPYGAYDSVTDIGVLYDSVTTYDDREDTNFYVDLCRKATGDILELGCGTGRVLVPAAKAGCHITGLDYSRRMLEACRQKLPDALHDNVTLVQGDMTRFRLDREFSLITIPFRPFQHLVSVEEQISCLRSIHQHLAAKGKLVFDVFHPDPSRLAGPPDAEEIPDRPEIVLPDGRRIHTAFRVTARHPSEQINETDIIYYLDGQRFVQSFAFRYYFRFEIEHLLARMGFRVAALYGDFDRSPFADDSPEMIFVAEKAAR
jgi:SAM-dependent methyltransferase